MRSFDSSGSASSTRSWNWNRCCRHEKRLCLNTGFCSLCYCCGLLVQNKHKIHSNYWASGQFLITSDLVGILCTIGGTYNPRLACSTSEDQRIINALCKDVLSVRESGARSCNDFISGVELSEVASVASLRPPVQLETEDEIVLARIVGKRIAVVALPVPLAVQVAVRVNAHMKLPVGFCADKRLQNKINMKHQIAGEIQTRWAYQREEK